MGHQIGKSMMSKLSMSKTMRKIKREESGDPMEVKVGFMKGMDGIFKEKNNNNHNKTRKMGKTLFDRVVSIFKSEEPEAKMKPTQYPRATKNKSSLHKNKDIKD